MKMCALVVATAASCLASTTLLAQRAVRTLTIEAAVDEAVQRNLGLLAERANLSIAEAALITARLRPNPVLSGGANSLDWLGTGFNDINGAGPPEYAVRVDVPFERARKRELRAALADEGKRLAEAQFADAVRRLRLDVTLACVDVLEAKARLALAQDTLQALDRLLQLNERRLTSGAIPGLEVSRSRVAMLQYRGNVRTAQLGLTQARLKLLPLLGRTPADAALDVDDRLGVPPAPTGPDLERLQALARTRRPDLIAARSEQARTQADLRLQIAQGKVDYALGAEYRRQQGVNGRGNLLGLFLSVPLPVFSRNQGEIARAEAEGDKAARSVSAVETALADDVALAYEEYNSSRQLLIEIERDLLEPAGDTRSGTTYMYQAGATSLLDVLDAQRAYNDTMDTYYTAQAAHRRASAKLALVVGTESIP
jgi:cobalt-zinc-cadmium efflux system outer membrane protein